MEWKKERSIFTYQFLWYVIMIYNQSCNMVHFQWNSQQTVSTESFLLTFQSKLRLGEALRLLWRLDRQGSKERPTSYAIHPQMETCLQSLWFLSPFGKLIDWWINSILQIEFTKRIHCLVQFVPTSLISLSPPFCLSDHMVMAVLFYPYFCCKHWEIYQGQLRNQTTHT